MTIEEANRDYSQLIFTLNSLITQQEELNERLAGDEASLSVEEVERIQAELTQLSNKIRDSKQQINTIIDNVLGSFPDTYDRLNDYLKEKYNAKINSAGERLNASSDSAGFCELIENVSPDKKSEVNKIIHKLILFYSDMPKGRHTSLFDKKFEELRAIIPEVSLAQFDSFMQRGSSSRGYITKLLNSISDDKTIGDSDIDELIAKAHKSNTRSVAYYTKRVETIREALETTRKSIEGKLNNIRVDADISNTDRTNTENYWGFEKRKGTLQGDIKRDIDAQMMQNMKTAAKTIKVAETKPGTYKASKPIEKEDTKTEEPNLYDIEKLFSKDANPNDPKTKLILINALLKNAKQQDESNSVYHIEPSLLRKLRESILSFELKTSSELNENTSLDDVIDYPFVTMVKILASHYPEYRKYSNSEREMVDKCFLNICLDLKKMEETEGVDKIDNYIELLSGKEKETVETAVEEETPAEELNDEAHIEGTQTEGSENILPNDAEQGDDDSSDKKIPLGEGPLVGKYGTDGVSVEDLTFEQPPEPQKQPRQQNDEDISSDPNSRNNEDNFEKNKKTQGTYFDFIDDKDKEDDEYDEEEEKKPKKSKNLPTKPTFPPSDEVIKEDLNKNKKLINIIRNGSITINQKGKRVEKNLTDQAIAYNYVIPEVSKIIKSYKKHWWHKILPQYGCRRLAVRFLNSITENGNLPLTISLIKGYDEEFVPKKEYVDLPKGRFNPDGPEKAKTPENDQKKHIIKDDAPEPKPVDPAKKHIFRGDIPEPKPVVPTKNHIFRDDIKPQTTEQPEVHTIIRDDIEELASDEKDIQISNNGESRDE